MSGKLLLFGFEELPAIRAAARITPSISPPRLGGDTMTISLHPAILAGMAFISTLEG